MSFTDWSFLWRLTFDEKVRPLIDDLCITCYAGEFGCLGGKTNGGVLEERRTLFQLQGCHLVLPSTLQARLDMQEALTLPESKQDASGFRSNEQYRAIGKVDDVVLLQPLFQFGRGLENHMAQCLHIASLPPG